MCFSEESVKDVLQHLSANHEQELCRLHTNTYAKMTILGGGGDALCGKTLAEARKLCVCTYACVCRAAERGGSKNWIGLILLNGRLSEWPVASCMRKYWD